MKLPSARTLLVALFLVHGALVLYYVPPSAVFSGHPPVHRDYTFHFANSHFAAQAWSSTGQGWGYNPHYMAGYPSGLVFDVDNKALSAVNIWLGKIVGFAPAFFLLVWAVLFFTPFLLHRAARNFGFSPGEATAGLAAVLLAWYAAPTVRWCWVTGMISHLAAAAVGLWFLSRLAKLQREGDGGSIGPRDVLPAALVIPVMPWIHPLVFFVVALPAAIWFFAVFRRLSRGALAVIAAGVVAAPVLNAYWLWPLLTHGLEHKTASNQYLQGGLAALGRDLLGEGQSARYPNVLVARWIVLAAAVAGIFTLLRRGARSTARWVGLLALWCFGFAYLAVHLGGGDLQPFRLLSVGLLVACLPAGAWLAAWFGAGARWKPQAILLALLGVVALPSLVTAIETFRPRPDHVLLGRGVADEDRILATDPALRDLYAWLADAQPRRARVACEDSAIGGYLPYYTSREVIGGPFGFVYLREGHANAEVAWGKLAGRFMPDMTSESLKATLNELNIGLMVGRDDATSRERGFGLLADRFPNLMTEIHRVGPYVVYRTGIKSSPFFEGTGRLTAEFNRLRAEDVSPGPVVLKYHYCDKLRTLEGFALEPWFLEGTAAPYIRVIKGNERDFTIVMQGSR